MQGLSDNGLQELPEVRNLRLFDTYIECSATVICKIGNGNSCILTFFQRLDHDYEDGWPRRRRSRETEKVFRSSVSCKKPTICSSKLNFSSKLFNSLESNRPPPLVLPVPPSSSAPLSLIPLPDLLWCVYTDLEWWFNPGLFRTGRGICLSYLHGKYTYISVYIHIWLVINFFCFFFAMRCDTSSKFQ